MLVYAMPMFRAALAALLLSQPVALFAEITELDNEALKDLIARGVPLIDVRTPGEWQQTGIVEGSRRLTFFDENGRFDAPAWLKALADIAGPDDPVILICATGGRTKAISYFLDNQVGYNKVHHVTQGIVSWINAGNPTVPPHP